MVSGVTAPAPIGRAAVVGAGTMGAGIAQLLAEAGAEVQLLDITSDALERALEQIDADLRQGVQRGRRTEQESRGIRARLTTTERTDELSEAQLIIEAVPEQLEMKRQTLSRIAAHCPATTLLATNTSSLLVSEIAAGIPAPERVLGLHFFNPAPRMRLVEVVAGVETSPETMNRGVQAVEAMGKQPVRVRDGIGFLVNRCARPFYGEALKLVQEGIATVEQVDRICRLGGGFRLGPFELIDLIGVDVNLSIARSFYDQSFGEPRWRPNPIQTRLVAAGHLGRKSGQGFYDYRTGVQSAADEDPPASGGGDGRTVIITGTGPIADLVRTSATRAQFEVLAETSATPWLTVDASLRSGEPACDGPRVTLCVEASLRRRGPSDAAGFHALPGAQLVELTRTADSDPRATQRAEEFFACLGFHVEMVGDAPGLVLGRIVVQLINEAAFAVTEGVATAEDIDLGMTQGLNHPHGPRQWLDLIGESYVTTLIDALYAERHEERYRLAPRLAASEHRSLSKASEQLPYGQTGPR